MSPRPRPIGDTLLRCCLDVRARWVQPSRDVQPSVSERMPPEDSVARGDLASTIDHTLLRADASREALDQLCAEAERFGFAAVCVNAVNVSHCAHVLRQSAVKVVATIGFPLGASDSVGKAVEAWRAVRDGADEVDMMIDLGGLKDRDYQRVLDDIKAVTAAAGRQPVKVIIEASELDHDEKCAACVLAQAGGAVFVKTSTGFASGGATAEDVRFLRRVAGASVQVKASGGIRTAADADRMIDAGASRIGTSAGVAIVAGAC